MSPVDVSVDWRALASEGPGPAVRGVSSTNVPGIAIAGDLRLDDCGQVAHELGVPAGVEATDLLAHAYRRWGLAFVERLRGEFAFVLWDHPERRVVAVRDPFGLRGLHHAERLGTIRFCSHANLLALNGSEMAFDDRRVVEYLLFRYRDLNSTFFRGVSDVPPGHAMVVDAAGFQFHRFWRPPLLDRHAPGGRECQVEFRRLFLRAVEKRLSPSGSVIQVSGGLDSSAIAGAADHLRSEGRVLAPLHGAAAVYPGLTCDESTFIGHVARFVTFPISTWDGKQSDPIDLTDPALDEPGTRVTTTGGTADDRRIARERGISAILSGFGGDQLGLPAGVDLDLIAAGRWISAARSILLERGTRRSRTKEVLRSYLPRRVLDPWMRRRATIPQWLADRVHCVARDLAVPERWPFEFESHVQEQLWHRLFCAETIRALSAIQQEGASGGVEYRFPFLDIDLVRFMLSLPFDRWPAPGPYARYHRVALSDLLPLAVRDRSSKAEFTPALANRVRRSALLGRRVLDTGPWISEPYVRRGDARRAWDDAVSHTHTPGGTWRRLWAIVTLEAWMRSWRRV